MRMKLDDKKYTTDEIFKVEEAMYLELVDQGKWYGVVETTAYKSAL